MKTLAATIGSLLVLGSMAHGQVLGGEPQTPDPRLHGSVALSGCSGSLFRFQGQSLDSAALVLTNGHCLKMMGAYEVIVNRPTDREVNFYNASGVMTSTYRAIEVVYATMHQTDMAILKLGVTYQALKDEADVESLMLATDRGQVGEHVTIVSGLWEYVTTCTLDGFVHAMQEGQWAWTDSLRFSQECVTFGGTSGSPVISETTGQIVGVNNTGYEGGEPCSRNNPCEIDSEGTKTTVADGSYGQQTFHVYGCIDDSFDIDLSRQGCALPKPSGVLQIAGVELIAKNECDNDGNLDAGETAVLAIALHNDGPIELESTSLTIASGTSVVSFPAGTSVDVGAIGAFETKIVEVAVALEIGVSGIDALTFEVAANDPGSAAPQATLATVQRVNFDDLSGSSTTDDVESNTSAWTTVTQTELDGSTGWARLSDVSANTVWRAVDLDGHADQRLISPTLRVGSDALVVTFSHRYSFETSNDTFWDGGVLEVSTDGGATWSDAGEHTVDIGYGGRITNESGNPLSDRSAFVGRSPNWPDQNRTSLDFGTSLANKSIKLRFRLGTDAAAGDFGWEIDNLSVQGITNLPFSSIGDDQDPCGAEPPPVIDPPDEGEDSGGCSAGGAGASSWWLLAMIALLLIGRRRSSMDAGAPAAE